MPFDSADHCSQHIPKKYYHRRYAKKGVSLAETPKLAPKHAIELRVLETLGLTPKTIVSPSNVFRLDLDPCEDNTHTIIKSNGMADPKNGLPDESPPKFESSENTEDKVSTTKRDESSSRDDSIILTINLGANVESPLEWSARMKRYQEEEIEYLGLQVIKPRVSRFPAQQTAAASRNIPRSARMWALKEDKLSKQRFEEWLDTITPRASPTIPASQPSTVAESDRFSHVSENDLNVAGYENQNEDHPCIPLDPNQCSECGRKIWSDPTTREYGVQTDISERLITI